MLALIDQPSKEEYTASPGVKSFVLTELGLILSSSKSAGTLLRQPGCVEYLQDHAMK